MIGDGQLIKFFAIGRTKGESRNLEIRRTDGGLTALVDDVDAVWAVRSRGPDSTIVGMRFFVENVSMGANFGEMLKEHCDYWYSGEVYWDTVKDLSGVHAYTEDTEQIEKIGDED